MAISSRLRIAPSALVLGADGKFSKVYNSHFLAPFQRGFDDLERDLDKIRGVVFGDPVFLADSGDDFSLG
jgi:hypothetical protein